MTIATALRQSAITAACYALRPAFGLRRRRASSVAPRRILVLRRCCLGDVLMTTPLLATLAKAYPGAEITYATGPWAAQALANNPAVGRILTLPERWDRAAWRALPGRLRRERFDLAVIPERSPLPALATALAGIPRRVGLDSAGRGFALTDRVPLREVRHETDLALDLARALGLAPAERRLRYTPSTAATGHVAALLAERGAGELLFVVHPGGGSNPGVRMDTKRWPPERFARVADRLIERHGGTIALAGAASDAAAIAATRAALRHDALDFGGAFDFDQLAALCARATLYLGNDAGTTHLAAACGAPVVAVFGPTDPAQYGPTDGIGEAAWDPVACGPFVERGDLTRQPAGTGSHRCIDAIGAEQVVAACERVLGRASAARPAAAQP